MKRTNSNRTFDLTQTVESLGFFVTGENGHIVFIDPKGNMTTRAKHQTPIDKLIFCQDRNILVAVFRDISLFAYRTSPDGSLHELGRVKLSGSVLSCEWIG